MHQFAGLSLSVLGTAIASAPDDVWEFGSTGRTESTPWAVHFNGKSWSRVPVRVDPFGASGSAAAGDWIMATVGARPGTAEVVHWSKGAWRRVPSPKITVPKGDLLDAGLIAAATPFAPGPVGDGLARAGSLPQGTPAWKAADLLGNGQKITAADTVPFALWSAAHHLEDLPAALWTTAEGRGDVDTTCAITGGVVAARTGLAGVPARWLEFCEPLPG